LSPPAKACQVLKTMKKKNKIVFMVGLFLLGIPFLPAIFAQMDPIQKIYPVLPITSRNVIDFVMKHKDRESIVVDKESHLIYYLRDGKLVQNDYFRGRNFSFPLPISIGMGGRYETPEGEYHITKKNPYSRYTKFLQLSIPSGWEPYGIHAGPTYLARRYERLELKNPSGKYVTKKDDTRGCVAVETLVMKYLFDKIQVMTPVLIY